MSVRGVNQLVLLEPEILGLARLSGNVPKGITGSISAGAIGSFRRWIGMTGFAENVPEAEIQEVQGDGGIIGQYQRQASGASVLNATANTLDQIIVSELKNQTIYTEGAWEIMMRTRLCLTFQSMAAIVSGRVISKESGTSAQQGWYTIFYFSLTGQELPYPLTIGQVTGTGINFSANEVDTTWWEEDLSTNYGQNNSWATAPIIADYPIWVDTYVGNNSATTATLAYLPAAADGNSVQIWKDGVKQVYTTDYTVSTSTGVVTWAVAPASATDNVILYEYVPAC